MASNDNKKGIDLFSTPTTPPDTLNKKKIIKETNKMIEEIIELQYKFSAVKDKALLIILQGLDASGKDGTMRHVFSGMNPTGIMTTGFGVPSHEEASHDFLWRVHAKVPALGQVGFFNRSHYEDVLVPSVLKTESKEVIAQRCEQINDFEKMLQQNNVVVVKLFFHISKEVQKTKLNERLVNPLKYWKHNIGDWDTRAKFDSYIKVYQSLIEQCNKPEWHIIQADKNRYKHYLVAKVVLDTFKKIKLEWPTLDQDERTLVLQQEALAAQEIETKKK